MRKLSLFSLFVFVWAVSAVTTFDPHVLERKPTDFWAVKLEATVNPGEVAHQHGFELVGPVGNIPNTYLFKKKSTTLLGETHTELSSNSRVTWFEQQYSRQQHKRISISDPMYDQQWHLHPVAGLNNVHINALASWERNVTGQGVTIAVVDDGLQYTHPDLAPNYNAAGSWDFNQNDANPYPDLASDDHGTSAAGVAGAGNNNACGVGSGYRAQLTGIRLISEPTIDAQEAGALSYKYDINDIYTNSWGPIDDGTRKEGPGPLAQEALKQGVLQGRKGKGSVFVWAAGNGARSNDNCNYDGWANSRYTISIAATDFSGNRAYYSEECSCLVVSTPSSGSGKAIVTTDLQGSRGNSGTDCTSNFGGTSAAAPLAAGAIALVLQANPSLTWRDVQGVLIESATVTAPNDGSWQTNGGGFRVSHNYGYGLLNADAAVTKAQTWQNLPGEVSLTFVQEVEDAIPQGFDLVSAVQVPSNLVVEFVELAVFATHPLRGEIVFRIQSPHGTNSYLTRVHNDYHPNYTGWQFGSIMHWGENAQGTWSVFIQDGAVNANMGTMHRFQLNIHGHVKK